MGPKPQHYDYRYHDEATLNALTSNYNPNSDPDTFSEEGNAMQKTIRELLLDPKFLVALACLGMSIFVLFLYSYRFLWSMREKSRARRLAKQAQRSAKEYRRALKREEKKQQYKASKGQKDDNGTRDSVTTSGDSSSSEEKNSEDKANKAPQDNNSKTSSSLWDLAEDKMSTAKRETRTMAAVIDRHRNTILALEEKLAEKRKGFNVTGEINGSAGPSPPIAGTSKTNNEPVASSPTSKEGSAQISPTRGAYVSQGRTTSQLTHDVFGYASMSDAEQKSHDEMFRKLELRVLAARHKLRAEEKKKQSNPRNNSESTCTQDRGEGPQQLSEEAEKMLLSSVLSPSEQQFWESNVQKIRNFQSVLRAEAAAQWERRKEIIAEIRRLENEEGEVSSPEELRQRLEKEFGLNNPKLEPMGCDGKSVETKHRSSLADQQRKAVRNLIAEFEGSEFRR